MQRSSAEDVLDMLFPAEALWFSERTGCSAAPKGARAMDWRTGELRWRSDSQATLLQCYIAVSRAKHTKDTSS